MTPENISLEQLIVGMAFLALLVLAIVCLAVCLHQKKKLRAIGRAQETLLRKADEMLAAQEKLPFHQRDELILNLQQLNESLLNAFGQIARSQSEQVGAVIRQSSDHAQAFEQRNQTMQRMIDENLQRHEQRMENLRKSLEENMRLLREENAKRLSEMRATVDEKLSDTLEKRLNTSFSQISERLEKVFLSLGEVHSLAAGVGDLKRMLSNVKTRGIWGEIQLGALLEQALTSAQYEANVAVVPGSSERVEYAIRLPGKERDASRPVYLAIDSKFPQEDYARLAQASQNADKQAVDSAQKALLAAVKTEAKRISKYIAPPFTTDFAVMFLPLEGLYAEVTRHAEILESIQREYRVLIAGPSTLLALLNSLQMGFRTLAIEQRSAEVWKLLSAVKSDFSSFAVLLHKTQEKLQQASDSIDSAFVKTRTIEKKLKNVEVIDQAEARQLLMDKQD